MTKKPKRPAPPKYRNPSPKKPPRRLSKAARLKASQEAAAKRCLERIRKREEFVNRHLGALLVRFKHQWALDHPQEAVGEEARAKEISAFIRPTFPSD